jgi:hypothetical protein
MELKAAQKQRVKIEVGTVLVCEYEFPVEWSSCDESSVIGRQSLPERNSGAAKRLLV